MGMMDDIKRHVHDWSSEKEVKEYLRKIIRKEAYDRTGLIYGQGHAVYTISFGNAISRSGRIKSAAANCSVMNAD